MESWNMELCIALLAYSIAPPLPHSIDSNARFVFLPAPPTVMVSGADSLNRRDDFPAPEDARFFVRFLAPLGMTSFSFRYGAAFL